MERWKVANSTEANPQPKPTLDQYDKICDEWRAKDKVAKFVGMYSSKRLYSDWQVAEPVESIRNKEKWPEFVRKMQEFYKPTDNPTHIIPQFSLQVIVAARRRVFSSVLQSGGKGS